jgi:DNA-binding NarL/FixJ family response regulator
MDHRKNQLKSPSQVLARTDGMRDELETEAYWDQLTDEDRRLIWLAASGKDVREVAADVAETPREVARRYRTLLGKLGLDDRLSLVLAAVARTARAPIAARWI